MSREFDLIVNIKVEDDVEEQEIKDLMCDVVDFIAGKGFEVTFDEYVEIL